ncbi:MAG TPA: rhamnogalacturonan lyase [Fibrobacteria bacterium]|nr:rhamnogalacturonan lyase [Fibrobacteria bacterium]
MKRTHLLPILAFLLIAPAGMAAPRNMEYLDRGLVAIKTSGGVFVSWRVLGTDDATTGFNVYRDGSKVNSGVITGATNLTDASGTTTSKYVVKTVVAGMEIESSTPVSPWSGPLKRIPVSAPAGGTTPDGVAYTYSPNDGSVGDLNGDGNWDLVLKWDPSNSQDNANDGYTGKVYLDGMTLDGDRMWRIDLGWNIRAGAHYTQFMVADFDGDGIAEIICKTAPGTKDGTGKLLSTGPAASDDDAKDYRNSKGFVTAGPEYLTVFNGQTGAELATVLYVPGRDPANGWGKTSETTNRVDRFLAGVAWIDGVKPHAIMQRGYYGRMAVTAWSWDGTTLKQQWYYNAATSGQECHGQGNHNLSIADVDADGKDEIIQGACAIDHDGKFMYRTGLGHGDAMHLGDLDPSRPGLEAWVVHEDTGTAYAHELHDARTGAIIWGENHNKDNGRGLAADIDATSPGHEMWSASFGGIYNTKGTQIGTSKPTQNFRIYWDGDLQDELLDVTGTAPNTMKIDSWKNGRLLTTNSTMGGFTGHSNNYSKANPVLSADIFGDWREELIVRQDDNSALLVYSTTIPTTHRLYTLMHDPVYRAGVAWQNTAYNQPPHLGFWLGAGVDKAPKPDIKLVKSTSGIGNPRAHLNSGISAKRVGSKISIQSHWNEPVTIRIASVDGRILSEHSTPPAASSELDAPAGSHGALIVSLRGASGRAASTTIPGF